MYFLIGFFTSIPNLITLGFCTVLPLIFFKSKDSSLINYIPAFCTSVGIMMTFTVLYLALGVNISELSLEGEESLKSLIQQLSNKFSCSLIGIFFSILWSIIIRFTAKSREEKSNGTIVWRQKNPQELLWEITQSQMRTMDILANMATSFQEFDDRQGKRQRELRGDIYSISSSVEKYFASGFSGFNELLGKHIEELGSQTMQTSKQSIEQINESLKDLTGQLVDKHLIELRDSLTQINNMVRGVEPVLARTEKQFIDQMEQIRRSVDMHNKTIQSGFGNLADDMQSQIQGYVGQVQDSLQAVEQAMIKAADNVHNTSQHLLDKHLDKLDITFDSLESAQSRAQTLLDNVTKAFAEAVASYERKSHENVNLLEQVAKQTEQIGHLQENAEEQLGLWSQHLGEMVEVQNRVNDLANTIDQLQQLNDQLRKMIPTNHHG